MEELDLFSQLEAIEDPSGEAVMMKNGGADIIDEISKSPKQHKSLRAS